MIVTIINNDKCKCYQNLCVASHFYTMYQLKELKADVEIFKFYLKLR